MRACPRKPSDPKVLNSCGRSLFLDRLNRVHQLDVRDRSMSTARPKSPILATPFAVSQTFPGFRSRCAIPRLWANSRPRQVSVRVGEIFGVLRLVLDFHDHLDLDAGTVRQGSHAHGGPGMGSRLTV